MNLDIVARCSREIVANLLMGIGPIARLRTKAGRTSKPASEDNIRRFAFGIVLDNPHIQPLIPNASVLEIGPGDHLATGLTFLACGAASYSALDRFPGDYRGHAAQQWYTLVRDSWQRHFNTPWPAGLENFPDLPNVHSLSVSIEEASALPLNAFDLVVSQAVGEHVQNIDAFADATFRMLKHGGTALHVVDFSNHGLFDPDPLQFLTIGERTWRMMGSNRGLPNRRRVHEFEAAFAKHPFSRAEILDRSISSAPIPQALAHLPEESVRTSWAVFLLVK